MPLSGSLKARSDAHTQRGEVGPDFRRREWSKTSVLALIVSVSISAALRVVRIFVVTEDSLSSRECRASIANRTAQIDQSLSVQRG